MLLFSLETHLTIESTIRDHFPWDWGPSYQSHKQGKARSGSASHCACPTDDELFRSAALALSFAIDWRPDFSSISPRIAEIVFRRKTRDYKFLFYCGLEARSPWWQLRVEGAVFVGDTGVIQGKLEAPEDGETNIIEGSRAWDNPQARCGGNRHTIGEIEINLCISSISPRIKIDLTRYEILWIRGKDWRLRGWTLKVSCTKSGILLT